MDPAQNNNQTPAVPTETPPTVQSPVSPEPAQEEILQAPPQTDSVLAPQGDIISENVQPPSPKSNKLKLLFLFLFIFLLILLGSGAGLAYAVAYEKIKLDKYPDLQRKVSHFVIGLSFMPKTPKYLLEKSGLKHQDVTKQSFDISVAVDSADLLSELGLSNLDVAAKGAIDYSDPKNVKVILDASLTKEFNFELKKKDKMLYFKLNKVPSFLFAFFGIKNADLAPVLDKWIAYDTTPLDTEARKEINDNPVDPLSEEFLEDNFNKYIDDKVLSKMQLSEVTEDSMQMYKITVVADPDLIDELGKKIEEEARKQGGASLDNSVSTEPQKLSEIVKSFEWTIYIDKKEYYSRKIVISASVEYDQGSLGGSYLMPTSPSSKTGTAKIAFVAKSGDFGKDLTIDTPESSMTFEEFTDTLSEIFRELYGNRLEELENNNTTLNDSIRITQLNQIKTALEAYSAVCGNGKYPDNLDALASENCQELSYVPKDPNGSDYYYQVSEDKGSYDLCALLDTPSSGYEAIRVDSECPDPSYNFHMTSPN